LKTTSPIIVKAAGGTEPGVAKSKLKANPIITYRAVAYKF
jgi:outer membrane protein